MDCLPRMIYAVCAQKACRCSVVKQNGSPAGAAAPFPPKRLKRRSIPCSTPFRWRSNAALRQQPLDTLFAAGQKRLTRKVQAARLMHDELTRSLFSTPNAFYRATLVNGIAGFFKLYRSALFAQETHITADYPLFLPLQNQTGIEFIERYLQNALCENGFLRCFPAEAVHELICTQHADYALIPMNLLEPTLTAALLCALDGLPANSLHCAPDTAERLLRGRSASDLAERFAAVLPALCREIHCPPRFQSYLHRCLPPLAAVLTQNHPLEKPEP